MLAAALKPDAFLQSNEAGMLPPPDSPLFLLMVSRGGRPGSAAVMDGQRPGSIVSLEKNLNQLTRTRQALELARVSTLRKRPKVRGR